MDPLMHVALTRPSFGEAVKIFFRSRSFILQWIDCIKLQRASATVRHDNILGMRALSPPNLRAIDFRWNPVV